MIDNPREFEAGPDPFGRKWKVHFNWLQTGISIRHADTVDVKFAAAAEGEPFDERVVALPHLALLAVSAKVNYPLTDSWCLKMAALHMKHMIATAEDMEKTLVTLDAAQIEQYARSLDGALAHK